MLRPQTRMYLDMEMATVLRTFTHDRSFGPACLVRLVSKGGRTDVFLKSANRKSALIWSQSAIANPQNSQVCKSTNFKSANFFWLIRKSQIRKLPHLRKIREYNKFADLWFARYSHAHLTLLFAHLPFSLVATQLQRLTICIFSKCDNMLLRVCFSKECKSFWS
jgi:hypothetical protein